MARTVMRMVVEAQAAVSGIGPEEAQRRRQEDPSTSSSTCATASDVNGRRQDAYALQVGRHSGACVGSGLTPGHPSLLDQAV